MNNREIRNFHQSGWFRINNEVVTEHLAEIGLGGLAVYSVLAIYANNGTQKAWPSVGSIAKLLGKSRRSVIRYIKKLEKAGLVTVTHQNGSVNVYTLLKVDERSEGDNDVRGGMTPMSEGGDNDVRGGMTPMSEGGDTSAHKLDLLTRLSNKESNNKKNNNKRTIKARSLKKKDPPKPKKEIPVKNSEAGSLKDRIIAKEPSAKDLAMALGLAAKEKHEVPLELAELFALRWGGWTWPPPSKATAVVWREFGRHLLVRCGGDEDGIKEAINTFFDSPEFEWEKKHFTNPDSFLDRLVVVYNQGEVAKQEYREERREAGRRFTQFISRPKPSKDEKRWQEVLEMLRGTTTRGTFQTYFKKMELKEHKDDTLVIKVGDRIVLDWIVHRLIKDLKWAVKEVFGQEMKLSFLAKDALAKKPSFQVADGCGVGPA